MFRSSTGVRTGVVNDRPVCVSNLLRTKERWPYAASRNNSMQHKRKRRVQQHASIKHVKLSRRLKTTSQHQSRVIAPVKRRYLKSPMRKQHWLNNVTHFIKQSSTIKPRSHD